MEKRGVEEVDDDLRGRSGALLFKDPYSTKVTGTAAGQVKLCQTRWEDEE